MIARAAVIAWGAVAGRRTGRKGTASAGHGLAGRRPGRVGQRNVTAAGGSRGRGSVSAEAPRVAVRRLQSGPGGCSRVRRCVADPLEEGGRHGFFFFQSNLLELRGGLCYTVTCLPVEGKGPPGAPEPPYPQGVAAGVAAALPILLEKAEGMVFFFFRDIYLFYVCQCYSAASLPAEGKGPPGAPEPPYPQGVVVGARPGGPSPGVRACRGAGGASAVR